MINSLLCITIFTVNIIPQNKFLDRYTIIAPLGQVKSIATSPFYVFAISDNYLLILDKQNLSLEQTIYFDQTINLVAYDPQYEDLWISCAGKIIRFTIASYNIREYTFSENINKLGVGIDYLYLDTGAKYSLNKNTGEIAEVNSFPQNLNWYKKNSASDMRNYPFLNPYYYLDKIEESQSPLFQLGITAIYDDGADLYVGTNDYGILKYNKVTWKKKRIVYGPLDAQIRKVRKFNNQLYFISSSGISYYPSDQANWKYLRLTQGIIDLSWLNNSLVFGFANRISRADGAVVLTISNFKNNIICLNSDENYFYIGTNSGLFKMLKGTNELLEFGPGRYAVYAVYPTSNEVYVGAENGFYKYNRTENKWLKVINIGIKNIIEIKNELYLLGLNNQLIKYQKMPTDSTVSDTNWLLLPYFNIYDIDTDNEMLYCASYAGIYYYEPTTELYKLIFDLPRIKYDYLFIVDNNILAVSNTNIYRLPIKYRD